MGENFPHHHLSIKNFGIVCPSLGPYFSSSNWRGGHLQILLCLQFDIFVGVYIRLVYIILIQFEFIIMTIVWVPQIYFGNLLLIKGSWEKLNSRNLSDYWFSTPFLEKNFFWIQKLFFLKYIYAKLAVFNWKEKKCTHIMRPQM